VSQTADHTFDSEILEGLPDRVLADLGGRFGAARFGKGELIYSPFDRADAMYVVQTGHPQMAINLLRSLTERLRTTEDQLESLAFRGVPARLASQLLQLMDRYGRVTTTGIRIDERFTHVQLAEMIGTSRETLTKVMNELREGGLIDVRERLVWVLDADGLERLRQAG